MLPIRVFLVDDNLAFLAALKASLAGRPGIQVVGQALSGPEGIEQVRVTQPELVLLDLVMPGMSGIEVLQCVKALPQPPRVAILSFQAEPEVRSAVLELGADGFVAKAEMGQGLFATIDALFPGRTGRKVPEN
jgi:DNA-binding NarL/FixJ family response regulator